MWLGLFKLLWHDKKCGPQTLTYEAKTCVIKVKNSTISPQQISPTFGILSNQSSHNNRPLIYHLIVTKFILRWVDCIFYGFSFLDPLANIEENKQCPTKRETLCQLLLSFVFILFYFILFYLFIIIFNSLLKVIYFWNLMVCFILFC